MGFCEDGPVERDAMTPCLYAYFIGVIAAGIVALLLWVAYK